MTDDHTTFTTTEWLSLACWIIAQSTLTICGPFSYSNIEGFQTAVIAGRRAFQFLIEAAVDATLKKKRANSTHDQPAQPASLASSQIGGLSPKNCSSQAEREARQGHGPQGETSTAECAHGTSPFEVAKEYGGCGMVFTFLGEDKHKEHKADISATNFHDPAPTLIDRENIRLTVSLLLDGCFESRYPEIEAIYDKFRESCPNLIGALNP
ncbi:hypothetical protein MRS44_002955 [Fusarium solani]|uniref:uncharacterized protein n=1 Tax=Fusarium solani TaxID=169388 RepID=UPI0032C48134|nr:hypothetical protein MRS44_002955 [Fusarium solani]